MAILVTGSAGHLGEALMRTLAAGQRKAIGIDVLASPFTTHVGSIVDRAVFRTERGTGPGYFVTVIVCQIVFGIAASLIVAWFSRQREFRADRGSAQYLGTPNPMINALRRLAGVGEAAALPESVRTLGITDQKGMFALFSTHPPFEQRIAALQGVR